jgi:hypothetical protein
VNRREFVATLGATALVHPSDVDVHEVAQGASLLVPMGDEQTNHLKAYGVTYRAIERGERAEWLLNYRGGSFFLPDDTATRRDAALAGVTASPVSASQELSIRGSIAGGNMDAIPLEKAPKVAVYVPPNAAPWDDAVTLALEYAGIAYDRVWDSDVLNGALARYDWLHLHHEDFTGQYSKFFVSFAGASWLADMVSRQTGLARTLGFSSVPALKRAVAQTIRGYVDAGGFLFAMCTATETLDLALASVETDIAAGFADGTPMAADAAAAMRWDEAFAFRDARLEASAATASFSDIDGHQVNHPSRRQPLGAFQLFGFSAKIDPVPTMLVQCHRDTIRDFYGLTTSFTRRTIKPGVVVLAEERGAPWAKYLHGSRGKGTWTFLGGHDPEDPEHQLGDPPTDLALFPNSPGYRLILNNVLFPAAKKRELKT